MSFTMEETRQRRERGFFFFGGDGAELFVYIELTSACLRGRLYQI